MAELHALGSPEARSRFNEIHTLYRPTMLNVAVGVLKDHHLAEDAVQEAFKYGGAISEDTFGLLMQKNEQERLAKAERLDALLSEVDKAEKEAAAIHSWAAIIRKYLNLQELDRAAVDELIDHIEVGERTVVDGQRRQDIKVFYRFVGLVK